MKNSMKKRKLKGASSLPAIKYDSKAENKMINIFDESNLDHPNALENKINNLVDDKSESSFNPRNNNRSTLSVSDVGSRISARSIVPTYNARQMALRQLKPSKDLTETAKEFVVRSREILMKEISISDKQRETTRLNEFIQMEQEKLAESKRTFDDDKEGYERYLDQLREDVARVEEDVKELNREKADKQTKIRLLNEHIYDIVSE